VKIRVICEKNKLVICCADFIGNTTVDNINSDCFRLMNSPENTPDL